MSKLLGFFIGFGVEFLKMLIGSLIISGIIGYFYFKALYVIVPLFLLVALVEGTKNGVQVSRVYVERSRLKKLKKEFKSEELYEFDKSWRTLQQNRK